MQKKQTQSWHPNPPPHLPSVSSLTATTAMLLQRAVRHPMFLFPQQDLKEREKELTFWLSKVVSVSLCINHPNGLPQDESLETNSFSLATQNNRAASLTLKTVWSSAIRPLAMLNFPRGLVMADDDMKLEQEDFMRLSLICAILENLTQIICDIFVHWDQWWRWPEERESSW